MASRGGKRDNSGRKKKEGTKVMRIPEGLVDTVNQLVEAHKNGVSFEIDFCNNNQNEPPDISDVPAPVFDFFDSFQDLVDRDGIFEAVALHFETQLEIQPTLKTLPRPAKKYLAKLTKKLH